MTKSDSEQSQRLFLALWPDDAVRKQLAALARSVDQNPIVSGNLHLTLVFLGNCKPVEVDCIRKVSAAVQSEPFTMTLDYLGAFPRSRHQWLGIQRAPAPLLSLAKTLRAALESCGYASESRRFVPHVTLSRRVEQPQFRAMDTPVNWTVGDFVLVESIQTASGVDYPVIDRWRLG